MINMDQEIYVYKGQNITLCMIILIKNVVKLIEKKENISFPEAVGRFYTSKTYQILKDTETVLWTESEYYIAEMYFNEKEENGE